jgi:hypothetical protein
MRALIAASALLILAMPAYAQQPPANAAPKPLGPRAPAAGGNPFALAPWASLDEPAGSSIRTQAQMDLAAREDRNYIEVFGRKKGPEMPLAQRIDGAAPAWSDAAVPQVLPLSNPTSCSGEAYQTIGGQAATGADMIGALSRGC